MNFNWFLNGTMEAHHLAAVYIAVWVIQGGYAGWIVWQWTRVKKNSLPTGPATQAARERL